MPYFLKLAFVLEMIDAKVNRAVFYWYDRTCAYPDRCKKIIKTVYLYVELE